MKPHKAKKNYTGFSIILNLTNDNPQAVQITNSRIEAVVGLCRVASTK